MSYVENVKTAEEFIQKGWPDTPHSRRVEEIVSNFNETNRFTDKYTYYWDQGGFYVWAKDKGNDTPYKIHVGKIIDRHSYPATAEAEVFDKLEDWFSNNSEGQGLWVSRSYLGKYPVSNIIFHQIAYTFGDMQKVLRNSAVLFDAPDEEIFDILHEFFPETLNINNLEAMRSLLITPSDSFYPEMLSDRIKEIDPNTLAVNGKIEETQLFERASYISNLIGKGASPTFIALEMQRLDLIGPYSITCPRARSFSELITGLGMEDQYGSLQFECNICREINTRPFGMLISNCLHCGASARC